MYRRMEARPIPFCSEIKGAPQHPGTEPVHPGDDATTAELAAYERALAEYGKALDLWEKYLARADGGVDYKPQSYIVQFSPGERKLRAGVALASAAMTTGVGETIKVRLSDAWLVKNGRKVQKIEVSDPTATGTIG